MSLYVIDLKYTLFAAWKRILTSILLTRDKGAKPKSEKIKLIITSSLLEIIMSLADTVSARLIQINRKSLQHVRWCTIEGKKNCQ